MFGKVEPVVLVFLADPQVAEEKARHLGVQLATYRPELVLLLVGYNDRHSVEPEVLAPDPAAAAGFRWRWRTLALLRVKEVRSTDLHTVAPAAPLAEAAAAMVEHKIGCLPVIEDGKLVGILTQGLLAELIAQGS